MEYVDFEVNITLVISLGSVTTVQHLTRSVEERTLLARRAKDLLS